MVAEVELAIGNAPGALTNLFDIVGQPGGKELRLSGMNERYRNHRESRY